MNFSSINSSFSWISTYMLTYGKSRKNFIRLWLYSIMQAFINAIPSCLQLCKLFHRFPLSASFAWLTASWMSWKIYLAKLCTLLLWSSWSSTALKYKHKTITVPKYKWTTCIKSQMLQMLEVFIIETVIDSITHFIMFQTSIYFMDKSVLAITTTFLVIEASYIVRWF